MIDSKGYTLEEMDDVFDSGLPAWRKFEKRSRLDELEEQIAEGQLKVDAPIVGRAEAIENTHTEKV